MKNPFDPGYYDEHDLANAGFRSLGSNVRIARNCTIIRPDRIQIGSNVRIDGYTSLIADDTAFIELGSFIHVGAYCLLSGGDGITMNDFSGLSQGVRIYSRTDDYTGRHLTNPTVPVKYTGVSRGLVSLGRHVIIGTQSIILPGITIGDGAAVGALSLVTKNLEEWNVYFGIPVRRLKSRSRRLLQLEAQLHDEMLREAHT
jgi:acetyltransferase-like isoleucine patch superfamily enzyme